MAKEKNCYSTRLKGINVNNNQYITANYFWRIPVTVWRKRYSSTFHTNDLQSHFIQQADYLA